MQNNNQIIAFENKKIRRHWDKQKEKWYFSVIDIIEILARNSRPRKYWNDLKKKLKEEGSELSQKIGQLKLESIDWKKYLTENLRVKLLVILILNYQIGQVKN